MNNSAHNLHANIDERTDRVTPPRHRTAFAIATAYKAARAGGDGEELLHDLLVDALEPRLREIYLWFLADDGAGGSTTAKRVARHFAISRNDSSTMLKLLVRLGLLERFSFPHTQGRLYYYGLPGFEKDLLVNIPDER